MLFYSLSCLFEVNISSEFLTHISVNVMFLLLSSVFLDHMGFACIVPYSFDSHMLSVSV